MTAPIRIDHFAHIEQSLTELNVSACQMGEQVQSLDQQVISQLSQLVTKLDKEIAQPRKFVPFV